MADTRDLLEKVEGLKLILVQRATGGIEMTTEYTKLRRELLAEPSIKGKPPSFLKFCTTLGEFWAQIKEKFGRYQKRRDYLRDDFLPVITMLEWKSARKRDPHRDVKETHQGSGVHRRKGVIAEPLGS